MRGYNLALEEFFEKGNIIAIFGSIIYLPEYANDLDFTLFTTNGELPFSSSPEYSDEIIKFFKFKFGRSNLRLDFTGRRDTIKKQPYDLSDLPIDDIRLEGYLLTGSFYPDREFLDKHYRKIYGHNFLEKLWLRYSDYVQMFPLQGERVYTRYKDIALLLKATERLTKDGHPELKNLIDEYRSKYNELNKIYSNKEINVMIYHREIKKMVPEFITAVKSLPL